MSSLAKMMMMRDGNRKGEEENRRYGGDYNRDRSGYNEYNVDTINYERYDGGMNGGIENRRRRDRRGRFMEMRGDENMRGGRYEGGGRMEMRGGRYEGGRREEMRMPPRYPRGGGGIENRIGYDMGADDDDDAGGEEMYWPPYWRGDMHYGEHHDREMQRGHGKGKMSFMPMDEHTAKKWVHAMKNADGSSGEKWSMEQAEQIMRQASIDSEPAEFYAVLNAIYSDYAEVAKKHHMDTVEYYVDMARAWLEDEDAVKHKAMAYYECVVKHEE